MRIAKKIVDALFVLAGLALAAVAVYESRGFPPPHDAQLGAAVFPRVVGVLLAVVALAIGVSSVLRGKGGDLVFANPWRVAAAFAATFLFALFLNQAGFVVLAPVYLAVLQLLAGGRSPLLLAGISLGVTGLVYLVFKVLLESPLPEGWLGG